MENINDKTQKLGEELDIEEIEKFSIKKDRRFSTSERVLYNIMITMEEIKEELKEEIKRAELARAINIVDNEFAKEFGLEKEEVKKPEKKEAKTRKKKPTDISKIKGK